MIEEKEEKRLSFDRQHTTSGVDIAQCNSQ